MKHGRFYFCAAAILLFAAGLRAEEKTEQYPDGKPKLAYQVDAEGKKQGAYVEYYESGQPKIKANYKDDLLDGYHTEYFESGAEHIKCRFKAGKKDGDYVEKDEKRRTLVSAEYKDDKLHGEYKLAEEKIAFPGQVVPAKKLLFHEGQLVYPKPLDYVEKELVAINGGGDKKKKKKGDDAGGTGPGGPSHQQGLKNLKSYRFLCDIPYADIVLDEELNKYGKAGAEICAAVGQLTHHPKNPGWPKERFDYAYHATTHSNLHMSSAGGGESLIPGSVHGYMFDSDQSNIDRVGHRRWCLNPNMAKVGFGGVDKFSAQMAHDNSRTPPADWDIIYYPARGYMSAAYFSPEHAWCVLLNPAKFPKGAKGDIKVSIYSMDKKFKKAKEPLKLEFFNVETSGFGYNWAIIFRPSGMSMAVGSRYWVEVEGVKQSDGSARPIAYMVEFFGRGGAAMEFDPRKRR